jgi:hypothetical protein
MDLAAFDRLERRPTDLSFAGERRNIYADGLE